jgi:hypothetical protein
MGQKITQQLEREEWNLPTPAAMFECLSELVDQGYRGAVHCYPVEQVVDPGDDETPPTVETVSHWRVEINGDDNAPAVVAVIDQVVVRFGGLLEAMTEDTYLTRFPTGESK